MASAHASAARGAHRFARWAAWFMTLALISLSLILAPGAARAAIFLDATVGDLKPEERVAVAHPQPVQLLFQFQTKGAPNRQATKFVKQQVIDTVKSSGLFSDVTEAPTPNGAILNIVIDDVPMADAASKGFVTGLTFGLKGTLARDDYVCTVDFVGGASASKITKTGRHSLYSPIGNVAAPPNGVKMANANEAVLAMVRQIVSHPLNDLAADRGFNLDVPAAGTAAAEPAAVTPAASNSAPAVPAPDPAQAAAKNPS